MGAVFRFFPRGPDRRDHRPTEDSHEGTHQEALRPLLRGHLRRPRSRNRHGTPNLAPRAAPTVEAERLAEALAAAETRRIGTVRSPTFGAYLTSQWLPAKKLQLATSTYRGYERDVVRHILPVLGRTSIRRLRYQQIQTAGLAAVGIPNEEGWVFTHGEGKTIHPHAVYESFKRIVPNAGVPEMGFHDLRHTHGSLLLKEGIPVKVVSARLGHAHIAHTLKTYQHVLPGMQTAAANAAERLSKPRPTVNKRGSNAEPPAPPEQHSNAKRPTGKGPGERRGNNRRKAD